MQRERVPSYPASMKIDSRFWCRAIVALLAIGLVGQLSAVDQTTDRTDAVDNYIRAEMAKQHNPGLALLVSRGGQVIRAQGYGFANVELSVSFDPYLCLKTSATGSTMERTLKSR